VLDGACTHMYVRVWAVGVYVYVLYTVHAHACARIVSMGVLVYAVLILIGWVSQTSLSMCNHVVIHVDNLL
jgi:hypothetical protein